MTACKGFDGIPVAPVSPLEVAHDKWGAASDAFAAFGHLKNKGIIRFPRGGSPWPSQCKGIGREYLESSCAPCPSPGRV